mgnify:CR=1 FL=1
MGKRIYVGNLPWSVTKVILENLFSGFGEIEDALVIANKFTGRSRGFGFVTFKEDSSAEKAVKEMHEKDVEGRKLVVREAMPLGERTPMRGHSGEKAERPGEERREHREHKEKKHKERQEEPEDEF